MKLATDNIPTMAQEASNGDLQPPKPPENLNGFLRAVGPLALTLRKTLALLILTTVGAVVAVFAPFVWSADEWTGLRIAAGIVAAVAIALDKVADIYEKRLAQNTLVESELTAEKSVDDLNVFISEAIETTFLSGTARIEAIKALRRTLVRCAAESIGDGSRASYYPMRRVPGGSRILDKPFHHVEHGRYDRPPRPFIETEDPEHEVWSIMDGDDEATEVRNSGDEVYGVDWTKKKYDTFYSVPVKANMVQFGFLSVNNAKAGAIGGAQRATILAMARTLALVTANHKGPGVMNTQAGFHTMSVADATLGNNNEEEQ